MSALPTVLPHLCPQNHPCPLVNACPVGAVSQKGFAAPEIDPGLCIRCGVCASSCGYGAVTDQAEGPAAVPPAL